LSSFVTDGLRALVLESFGYETKVFEFISGEHTAKNIMITAVKNEYSEDTYLEKVVEIEKMKAQFGLNDFYLDKLITQK
ncbi:MAG TPA: SAM-dependent methyltransferase, partial [Ignavibacteria bacterium]|nr:SAM-dependent methyltransferase [Ignavibacteria bacterium]